MSYEEKGIHCRVGPEFKRVLLDNPCFDDFTESDFSYCLARLPRYTGSLRPFYSVAEHSLRVAYSVPPEERKAALWHDAIEVVTNDIPSPVKAWLREHTLALDLLENKLWFALAKRFDLPNTLGHSIKRADEYIGRVEKNLLGPGSRDTPFCNWGVSTEKAESWWLEEVQRWSK